MQAKQRRRGTREVVISQLTAPPLPGAAAPCSGATMPGRSSTRATSVAKYQPPIPSSTGPSAMTQPSPSNTRSADAAANSTSCVADAAAAAAGKVLDNAEPTRSSRRARSIPRVGSSSTTSPGSSSPSQRG